MPRPEVDLDALERDGYLVVADVLREENVAGVLATCARITASLLDTELRETGTDDVTRSSDWQRQLIALTAATRCSYDQHYDISLPPGGELTVTTPAASWCCRSHTARRSWCTARALLAGRFPNGSSPRMASRRSWSSSQAFCFSCTSARSTPRSRTGPRRTFE